MKHQDHIAGKQVLFIIEQLRNEKTFIRMRLPEDDFEQLTIIDDIRSKGDQKFFIIDRPEGFSEDIAPEHGKQVHFEFTGVDRLPYFFHTLIFRIDSKEIWVTFPESIERKQLRRNFRVDVPPGTQMSFYKNGVNIENQVINLSLGGSFCALVRHPLIEKPDLDIASGDSLRDIELIFRSKFSESQRLKIRKAIVVRVEEKPDISETFCALHFIDMDKSEEKALTELIYIMQREYFKKRLHI